MQSVWLQGALLHAMQIQPVWHLAVHFWTPSTRQPLIYIKVFESFWVKFFLLFVFHRSNIASVHTSTHAPKLYNVRQYSRYSPNIFLTRLSKTTETLSLGTRSPNRDSNPAPLQHESRVTHLYQPARCNVAPQTVPRLGNPNVRQERHSTRLRGKWLAVQDTEECNLLATRRLSKPPTFTVLQFI
jgi:hypothetical protein